MDGPDVFFGDGDELGEAAVGVDAENIDLFADVAVARAARLADAAADVPLGVTRWPTAVRETAEPTVATRPTNSWPVVMPTFTRLRLQASHS